MLTLFLRPLALAFAVLIAPLAASAATPVVAPVTPAISTVDEDSQQSKSQAPEAANDDVVSEDKRICRHVKLDASSRRKTKVCRTTEEWRELNNPR